LDRREGLASGRAGRGSAGRVPWALAAWGKGRPNLRLGGF
jgi:hypothetical protein